MLSFAAILLAAAVAAPAAPAAPGVTPDAVTQHSIVLGGRTYAYTARAGTIDLQNDKDEKLGDMFYTAFTVDGESAAARPITFFYNGGPGSSTIWLRMGSFGPMRVQVGEGSSMPGAPYGLADNPYSLLDRTDEVFVDAPGTGFGRVNPADKKEVYGVDPDIRMFAQFVQRYITKFNRWNSPKFLFGESYGTPRSAMLVNYLQRREDIGINGVVLLSSVLDFSLDWDVNFTPTAVGGGDWAFPLYLPTEAAAAWYHHALPNQPATLDQLLPQVESFAMNEYLNALAQGANLSPSTYNDVVAKLHEYTGLSESYIRQSNLRVPYRRYTTELFRNTGDVIGRYDARFTSYNLDRLNDQPDFDPTDAAMDSAFVATGNIFLRQVLGYHTTLTYMPSINVFSDWDWKHNGAVPTNTAQDLASAMVYNPNLRVFSGNGYYDFATPFYATVYTLNHLTLPAQLQKNISYGFYQSGHMVYLHHDALVQFHDDLERWYQDTLHAGR